MNFIDIFKYSHQGGNEELPQQQADELMKSLEKCQNPVERGYGPELRKEILDELIKLAWTGQVKVSKGSGITIASQKNNVGLCIQTSGNMSRMYADLIKLQQMYLNNNISVGVFIMPTAIAARKLGDNLANSDRLESELTIFKKVIHMPLMIISFQ